MCVGGGEICPLLTVIDGQTCYKYVQVSSTSCLQLLTFYGYENVAAIYVWTNMVVGLFEVDNIGF